MQASTVNAIESTMAQVTTPVDGAQTVNNANKGELLDAAIGMAQTAYGFLSTFGKSLPGGPFADLAGVGKGIADMLAEYNGEVEGVPAGTIQTKTLLGTASDLVGVLGAVTLGIAAISALPAVAIGGTVVAGSAAAAAAGWATVGAITLVASAALGAAALAADSTIDLQPLRDQISAEIDALRNIFGNIYDQAVTSVFGALETAADGISNVSNSVANIVTDIFDFAGIVIDNISGLLDGLFNQL